MKKETLNWFVKNYIENKDQCLFLSEQAEIKYKFTKEGVYEGCVELRRGRTYKDLLETHIKLLGEMGNIGINSCIAGIKLREALLETGKLNSNH